MNITIDLRSLHTNQYSGVEHFSVQVLERLIHSDPENRYMLYYNAFALRQFDRFHFINAQYKQTRIPNRLLNVSMKLFGIPKLDSLAGDTDTFVMPNPNMMRLRQTTKLIVVAHDLSPVVMPEMYSLKGRLWHWLINLKKLYRRADKILAVSEYTKQTLVDTLGIDPNKITVGLLGVDHDRYYEHLPEQELRSVRNRYGLPGEFITFVGTVEPRKNVERLVKAFELLPDNTHLVIAGKLGWKYAPVLEAIRTSSAARRIHYIGYVPEADKPHLLKLSQALVWPSLYEGFGLPVLEAMAVGTPVVTSNVTSLPEVAGDAALLVNPYNVTDIAAATVKLLSEPAVWEHYHTKGLERVKQFNWQHTADALKSIV